MAGGDLMRIQELSAKTGLSKRTIHFYIQEELLTPVSDPGNGYYSFSDTDVERIVLIRSLRNADFSVSEIRAILHAPSAAAYYLNRLIKAKKNEIGRITRVKDSLLYMEQHLPLNPTEHDLYSLILSAGIPDAAFASEEDSEDMDYSLVSRFLWECFMPDEPLSNYQEFLWERLRNIAADDLITDYRKLDRYLGSLNDKEIEVLFQDSRKLHRVISDIDPSEVSAYLDKMKKAISGFLDSTAYITDWKREYDDFIAPNTRIYDSSANTLMAELSPFFASYIRNAHLLCSGLYEWLSSEEGEPVRMHMERTLGSSYDIDRWSHGQLMAMCMFSMSFLRRHQ